MNDERCVQCGLEGQEWPMIAIMSLEDLIALDRKSSRDAISPIDTRGPWCAVGICPNCYSAPTVHGHFFPREYLKHALKVAGSSSLGV